MIYKKHTYKYCNTHVQWHVVAWIKHMKYDKLIMINFKLEDILHVLYYKALLEIKWCYKTHLLKYLWSIYMYCYGFILKMTTLKSYGYLSTGNI